MKINHKRFTPDKVERLSNCEIFVFGSNLEGRHMGGAANLLMKSLVQNGVLVMDRLDNAMQYQQCMVDLKIYGHTQRNLLPMQRHIL